MHLAIILTLFGAFVLPSLAAPVDNAEAGPSTVGGTASGSAEHTPPGDSTSSTTKPATIEFGNVYGAAMVHYTDGPPGYKLTEIPPVGVTKKAKKTHQDVITTPHPFIPMDKDGRYYKGFIATHNPPILPGGTDPEHHISATPYGAFRDKNRKKDGKKVIMETKILTTPRYIAEENVVKRPKGIPESLHDGKFEELKKDWCKRGLGGCSRESQKAANRKSSTVSKLKAYNKATKSQGRVNGPAGGRGTSRSMTKKGHK